MVRPWLLRTLVLLGYVGAALLFTWPLPRQLASHVLGPLSGDTGVYIWNLWAFAHELTAGRFPLFASTVFALTPPVDLSLHNYTVALNLAALPLLSWFEPATVYNLLLLAALVVNGLAGYALVHRITGSHAASWLGGLLFGFSPFVVARTTGHLSLVAVAPLAVFWLSLDSWRRSGSRRAAACTGLAFAWALFTDPYFAVYCTMLAALFVAPLAVERRARTSAAWPRLARTLTVCAVSAAAVAVVIAVSGGWTVAWGAVKLRMHTPYTPMLVATACGVLRWAGAFHWRVRFCPARFGRISIRTTAAGAAAALIPLAPWGIALAYRLRDGASLSEPTVWRNGVPGLDVLGLLAPNPSHPLMAPFAGWFASRPGGFIENVGNIPWVVWVVIALAVWRYGARLPRWWVGVTVAFGLLSLGPFIHVAGVNTFVPGPWALLRFVPLLASARSPSRFAVVLTMGVAVLFGLALVRVLERSGRYRPAVLAAVAVALVVELAPMPRHLYSGRVPDVYRIVAADPRPVRILHLPFGFRDGTRTFGRFNTARLYYQTFHEKGALGGYLSRLPEAEIRRQRESRVVRALLYLSEGGPLHQLPDEVLRARGARFVRRSNLGYVVVNTATAPPAAVHYAVVSFGLHLIASADGLDLYRVPAYDGPEAAQSLARWTPHALGVNAEQAPASVADRR
jgi:hypothetical protein